MIKLDNVSFNYHKNLPVLKHINLTIQDNEIVGIVGESGSGKSTLASLLMNEHSSSEGFIKSDTQDILPVFQHASESFNPNMTIQQSLSEPLIYYKKYNDIDIDKIINDTTQSFNLPLSLLTKYPNELSGGQLQRFNLMRTLLAKPQILICDEITSNLDVIAEQHMLDILKENYQKHIQTLIMISHDLSVIQRMCQRMIVLQNGEIVDDFETGLLFNEDRHPYTKQLVQAFE
ncbi:ABC transporter ATP-binding protein [Staphylococcus pasteuri]|uniref:ABC transporter ATP-binding protein n=1 Tax=Staphylococcus pasteuri TaxID=45972 RepID=UPI0012B8705B|nr:ATP-binding cassette domain-containing protein [Staphylococcus pasteuri]MCT1925782.1 ATP-binding cassette domain-containing protein [Staphylococcus pasteuri]QQT11337.1 ATP-binding cassette domain-containing protein [Staphylococcus pasteuri]